MIDDERNPLSSSPSALPTDSALPQRQEVELNRLMLELTTEQQEVLPYLALGISYGEISRITGVSSASISKWMAEDDRFVYTLSQMREMRGRWALANLTAGGIKGIQVLIGYLLLNPFDPRIAALGERFQTAVLQERRRAAQFLVDQLGLKRQTVVHHYEGEVQSSLHVTDQGLDLIAQRVAELQQQQGRGATPLLDARIIELPADAPPYGILRRDEATGRTQCHKCYGWYRDLVDHVATAHPEYADYADYCRAFGIAVMMRVDDR